MFTTVWEIFICHVLAMYPQQSLLGYRLQINKLKGCDCNIACMPVKRAKKQFICSSFGADSVVFKWLSCKFVFFSSNGHNVWYYSNMLLIFFIISVSILQNIMVNISQKFITPFWSYSIFLRGVFFSAAPCTRWGIISGLPVTFCRNSGNYCPN